MKITRFLLIVGGMFFFTVHPAFCKTLGFPASQVESIQKRIEESKKLHDKCTGLVENSRQNGAIASSNYQKIKIEGFRQAAEIFSLAEQKFDVAGKSFNDAWIRMQVGLENNEVQLIQKGVSLKNTGIQTFNEGVGLLKQAHGVFNTAFEESNALQTNRRETNHNYPHRDETARQGGANPPPEVLSPTPAGPPNTLPVAALLVLSATIITSVKAFNDKYLFDRFLLHPWDIVRYKRNYHTLFTSGLIHADSMHLMINVMSFCFFAFPLETVVGHDRFFIIYLGSLFFSSLIVTAKNGCNLYYEAVGASGAIAGVIFSYILYRPTSRIAFIFVPVPIPAPLFAIGYVGYSYYMGKHKYDNIGHDAHLWGAVSGAVITLFLDPGVLMNLRRFLDSQNIGSMFKAFTPY